MHHVHAHVSNSTVADGGYYSQIYTLPCKRYSVFVTIIMIIKLDFEIQGRFRNGFNSYPAVPGRCCAVQSIALFTTHAAGVLILVH